MSVITLTTDFGAADWFVGTMKGAILTVAPRAQIVDISHVIPPGNIRAGAFALAAACKFFPKRTVHLAVVDPGVGTPRKAIAVQTDNYSFVGPDNGVLSLALARERIRAMRQLTNEELFLRPLSSTFHGRDIFAPVAARLSKGYPVRKLGPAIAEFLRLDWPEPRIRPESVDGEILYIDCFGNAITNIAASALSAFDTSCCEAVLKRKRPCPVGPYFQAVPAGQPVAVFGSSGFLEIAVNGGSAARFFRLKTGDPITVRQKRRQSASSS